MIGSNRNESFCGGCDAQKKYLLTSLSQCKSMGKHDVVITWFDHLLALKHGDVPGGLERNAWSLLCLSKERIT